MKEEALDSTMWRAGFGGGFGPVVRQTAELMNIYVHTVYKYGRGPHNTTCRAAVWIPMFHLIFCVSWRGWGLGECVKGKVTFLFLATPEDIRVHESHQAVTHITSTKRLFSL